MLFPSRKKLPRIAYESRATRFFQEKERRGEKGKGGKKGNLSSNRFRSTPSRYRNHFRPTTGWLDFVPLILRAASYPGITMETGDAVSMENRRQRYTKPTRDHEISACRLPAGHEISFNGSIGRGRGRRRERGERIERITVSKQLSLFSRTVTSPPLTRKTRRRFNNGRHREPFQIYRV